MSEQLMLLNEQVPAEPEYLAEGSVVQLPVAYSEGLSKDEIEAILETDKLPILITWPKRDLAEHKQVIDLYARRKPVQIGNLELHALVKVEEKWVLHATVRYLDGYLINHKCLDSIDLLVTSVDLDPNDRSKGRKVIGLSKALVHPVRDTHLQLPQS